jgi:hypothetical protein
MGETADGKRPRTARRNPGCFIPYKESGMEFGGPFMQDPDP